MNSAPTSPPAADTLSAVHDRFRTTDGAYALVVSGPSGVGKTSICRRLLATVAGLRPCVTTTTRQPREGEVDGKDYHFVSSAEYKDLIARDAFLERADVHGARYGCTVNAVLSALDQATVVLLEVDVQGARTWRKVLGNHAVSLFILPPSLKELEQRLTNRRSEAEDALRVRMSNAENELLEAPHYDYVVVNRDLDESVVRVTHILEAEKHRTARAESTLSSYGIDI